MTIPSLSTYGGLLHDLGYSGQLVDTNPSDVMSYVNTQTVAVQFGAAVASDSADGSNGCRAPAADGDVIIGIALKNAIRPSGFSNGASTNIVQYNQYDEVPVCRLGWIYVVAAENVTKGDQALSLTASNGAIGGTTGGAAGSGRVVIPNAKWQDTVASGQVGRVRIYG